MKNQTPRISKLKRMVRDPLFRQRIVPSKRGKGSYRRLKSTAWRYQ